MKKKIRSVVFIGVGTLCVVLGAVGIFVPILPTTPFLLLAAYFYARSSERFLNWLLTNRLFGKFISNYRSGLGIPLLQKILTIVALWVTIGASISLFVDAWWLRILLLVIATGVTIHLLSVKTLKPAPRQETGLPATIKPCNEQED